MFCQARLLAVALLGITFVASGGFAQNPNFKPYSGQPGKDVVWVPTPDVLVEKMLDLAKVTPQDYVIDLGSGDGRMVIAAAKRGAKALGVEYEPEMVELARARARQAGVANTALFVKGDMYEADISQATVLALFLLPENLDRLASKFLALKPGTRIVLNEYLVSGWTPDITENVEQDCGAWCTAHLYVVPAPVEGRWRVSHGEREGELSFEQLFQVLRGSATFGGNRMEISAGRLDGERIEFAIAGLRYTGRVTGSEIVGVADGRPWKAVKRAGP